MTVCLLVGSKSKQWKLDDVLNILATGFLKGGTGFLKSSAAGEMIKGGGSVNREIRVGITHVRIVCQTYRDSCMGTSNKNYDSGNEYDSSVIMAIIL